MKYSLILCVLLSTKLIAQDSTTTYLCCDPHAKVNPLFSSKACDHSSISTPKEMRKVCTHWLLPFHYVYNMKGESGHIYRKRVRIYRRLKRKHKFADV